MKKKKCNQTFTSLAGSLATIAHPVIAVAWPAVGTVPYRGAIPYLGMKGDRVRQGSRTGPIASVTSRVGWSPVMLQAERNFSIEAAIRGGRSFKTTPRPRTGLTPIRVQPLLRRRPVEDTESKTKGKSLGNQPVAIKHRAPRGVPAVISCEGRHKRL
jgi:hypothetical protein